MIGSGLIIHIFGVWRKGASACLEAKKVLKLKHQESYGRPSASGANLRCGSFSASPIYIPSFACLHAATLSASHKMQSSNKGNIKGGFLSAAFLSFGLQNGFES
jgi:hypothetical protein